MPDVDPVLPWIRPGTVGAEIGVSRGDSARALLDHGVRFLYMIDPWEDYEGLLDKVTPGAWEECYAKVVSCYPSRHAVLKMKSEDAARYIPPQLDFVWIDGNHRYEWVRKDLELYWPKLKKGGVFCGHDFTDNGSTCQVSRAVLEFLATLPAGHRLELALPCWVIQKHA